MKLNWVDIFVVVVVEGETSIHDDCQVFDRQLISCGDQDAQ